MGKTVIAYQDTREVAVKLIELIRKYTAALPEWGEFERHSSEETILYENTPGDQYRIWVSADCYRSELFNDAGKDSRYIQICIISENLGYMLTRPVLSGHKDVMLQKLPDEKDIDKYVGLFKQLILDLLCD